MAEPPAKPGKRLRHPLVLVAVLAAVIAGAGLLYDTLFGPSGEAAGTTIDVTTGGDSGGSGDCTLRQALASADTNDDTGSSCEAGTGDDVVRIPASAGPVIQLAAGQLTAGGLEALTIEGPGAAQLDVRGGPGFRVFRIQGDHAVTISGMTISHGDPTGDGGGILAVDPGTNLIVDRAAVVGNTASTTQATGYLHASGGGIEAPGNLTVRDSTVADNVVRTELTGSAGGANSTGGGISAAPGDVLIDRSAITGNRAVAVYAAASGTYATAQGGGIQIGGATANDLTITESTVSGNAAEGPTSALAAGVYSAAAAGTTLEGDTIASNAVIGSPAAAANAFLSAVSPHTVTVRDTIVSDPRGASSCQEQPVTSEGFNLEDANGCGFDQPTDLRNVDPMLGPLASNGGPTLTRALLPGSPAIDRGDSFGQPNDQRALTRPVDFPGLANADGGDGADVGAFEVQQACTGQQTPTATCEHATPPPPPGPTGQRAKALKKCKRIKAKAKRRKCRKRAAKLPL